MGSTCTYFASCQCFHILNHGRGHHSLKKRVQNHQWRIQSKQRWDSRTWGPFLLKERIKTSRLEEMRQSPLMFFHIRCCYHFLLLGFWKRFPVTVHSISELTGNHTNRDYKNICIKSCRRVWYKTDMWNSRSLLLLLFDAFLTLSVHLAKKSGPQMHNFHLHLSSCPR